MMSLSSPSFTLFFALFVVVCWGQVPALSRCDYDSNHGVVSFEYVSLSPQSISVSPSLPPSSSSLSLTLPPLSLPLLPLSSLSLFLYISLSLPLYSPYPYSRFLLCLFPLQPLSILYLT